MSESIDEFLLKEYDNLASAHFESQKQLAIFFRYYLLLFSLPVAIYGFFDGKIENEIQPFLAVISFSLALVGLLFFLYLVTLKNESILYARSVNGIRNYFFEREGMDHEKELSVRVLPRKTSVPKYKLNLSNPLFLIITIIDSLFLFLGFFLCSAPNQSVLLDFEILAILILEIVSFAYFHYRFSASVSNGFEEKMGSNLVLE